MANDMRAEREKRLELEIAECKRKFRARPVPAHVTQPLYEQKRVNDELRRNKLKEMSRVANEERTVVSNSSKVSKSASFMDQTGTATQVGEFQAQPLPKFYFNEFAEEE